MRIRPLALAVVVASSLGSASRPVAGADPEPLRLPLDPKILSEPRTLWYGLSVAGAKSGWVRETLRREGDGAAAVAVAEYAMRIQARVSGRDVRTDSESRMEFDLRPPYALRSGRSRKVDEDGVTVVVLTRGDSGYRATVDAAGTKRDVVVPHVEYTLEDALTSNAWFAEPRRKGDVLHVRSFDVDDLEPDVHTTTVTEVLEPKGPGDARYEAAQRSRKGGSRGTARLAADGTPISIKIGGLFEARLVTEEEAKALEKGPDLFRTVSAPVDGRIASGAHVARVRELVLEARGAGAASLKSAPRQSVSVDGRGVVVLRLGSGQGPSDDASVEEISEARKETVDYPTMDPRVTALARKAVGQADTSLEKVERLVHFVSDFVEDEDCPTSVPALRLLESRRGDCSEHALLFVTLARAAEIPAREVSGFMYMGDEVGAFGAHAWAEVVLDGHWVPVDPTHDEVFVDATHVVLEREGGETDYTSVLGRVTFRVKSVDPAPRRRSVLGSLLEALLGD